MWQKLPACATAGCPLTTLSPPYFTHALPLQVFADGDGTLAALEAAAHADPACKLDLLKALQVREEEKQERPDCASSKRYQRLKALQVGEGPVRVLPVHRAPCQPCTLLTSNLQVGQQPLQRCV